MCNTAYLEYITCAARRVAALCCREGWPALAAKVCSQALAETGMRLALAI